MIQIPGLHCMKTIRSFMCRIFLTTVIKRDEWEFLNIRFVKEGDIRQMKINVNDHVFEKETYSWVHIK
jgi:hypothetical protein